jgi:type II secretory pathway component PulF
MPRYHYTAISKKNIFTKDVLDAWSAKKAVQKLEKKGLLVVNIKREEKPRWERFNHLFDRVSRLDKIFLTRHLMTMLESGISLDQALHIASEQANNRRFRLVLQDLYKRVQKGEALHLALSHYPKYFSSFYINLIHVGETSGKLEQTLEYLLEQQERDYELLTKTRSAMMYPSIIIGALCIIVIFMMTFVVPRVTGVLTEYNVTLPLATRILIGLSRFLTTYGLYCIPGLVLLVYLFRRAIHTPRGKWYWDACLLKIPRFRTIFVELNCARLTRSMSAMMKSGIPIDKAVALASEVTSHSHYQ